MARFRKSGGNTFNRKQSGDDEREKSPTRPACGRCHGRKCKPSPDGISPEKARKIALFAVCPKTQIKRTNQQPAEEQRSSAGRTATREQPPREAEPRTLPRSGRATGAAGADHRSEKERRTRHDFLNYLAI